ncbi:alpha/beta hydrolase fold domain-containing protein [Actinocrispum sp. NPDC049592]|uniref:alpha/beta hydrolase fold domain-containing protein n=1 Tax=Actinocrispum sp. NPDC049592 TaxID=3154835 RepID=UPI00341DBBFD
MTTTGPRRRDPLAGGDLARPRGPRAGVPAAARRGDVLRHVLDHATVWGIDPPRTALFGESCGALIAALIALRGKDIRAQVMVNPALDVTAKMFDHDSMTRHAQSPMLTMNLLRFFHTLAIPLGTDPEPLPPLHADLTGVAPALVVVPTVDPVADHGRRYVERLREAGTPARLTEHPGAPHAFLSLPNLMPQAKIARAEITAFLREHLADQSS